MCSCKQSLLPRVTPVDTASQFVLFLNIAGVYKGNRRHCNALLGTVYIHRRSLYIDGDWNIEIENELSRLCNIYDEVCLVGDFNSRTKLLGDYLQDNDYIT